MADDWSSWHLEPGVAAGLGALAVAYALAAGRFRRALLRLGGPPPGWLAPGPAFLLFNAVFAIWHVPVVYELSLRVAPLHALEHAAFAGLALLTWWPVFGPVPEFPRLPYGAQVVYLFFES